MVRGTPSHCNQILPPGPQAAPAQTCRQRHEHRRRSLTIESHHESMQVVNLAMHASRRRRFEGFHPARSNACVPNKERSERKVRRFKPRVNPDRDQATTCAAEITKACLRSSPPCSPCSKPLKSSQPEPPTLISRTKCPRQTNSIFRRPICRGHLTFLYIRRQSSRQSTSQSQTKPPVHVPRRRGPNPCRPCNKARPLCAKPIAVSFRRSPTSLPSPATNQSPCVHKANVDKANSPASQTPIPNILPAAGVAPPSPFRHSVKQKPDSPTEMAVITGTLGLGDPEAQCARLATCGGCQERHAP